MFKKNQWVKIKKTGEVGKIVDVWGDDDMAVEVNEVIKNSFLKESELEPAPKTWETLEVGDIIVRYGQECKVLAILGNVFLKSSIDKFSLTGFWVTIEETKNDDWKIKGASTDVVEMTVEQISKELGKTVKVVK